MIPNKFLKYNPTLFARGKRGLIYRFRKNKIDIAIKVKNPESRAHNRIKNEINFLKLLNKYNIGPEIIENGEDYFCYKLIEGKLLRNYLKEDINPEEILQGIMNQCKILDKLNINKEEFHNPIKNIIINKNKPILLDFERCHYTSRPKNVNQFKEFLRRLDKKKLI